MNIFFVVGIIVLQVVGYSFGAYVMFDEKKWNRILPFIVLIVSMFTDVICGGSLNNMMFMTLVAILVFCSMLAGTWRHRIIIAIKTLFIAICFEEMLESVVSLIILLTSSASHSSIMQFIMAETLLLGMWLMVKLLKQRGWKLPKQYTSTLLNITLGILALALLMVIAGIAYAEPYVHKESFDIMGSILSTLSYSGIATLAIFVIYIKNANNNYKELLELEEMLRISQQYNYEMLLAREEETRDFRHDISNHLICLKEIVARGNISLVTDYLNDMNLEIYQIQKKHFSTGNEIIDAIVNYYVQQLDKDVALSLKGVCIHSLEISNMELCSIVSNLMQNAIEALRNQQHGEKYLRIRLDDTQGVFELKISNSIGEEPILATSGLPMTSKIDKKNHGIGLRHVKKLVEQVRGLFRINIKNKEFQITLILPVVH